MLLTMKSSVLSVWTLRQIYVNIFTQLVLAEPSTLR